MKPSEYKNAGKRLIGGADGMPGGRPASTLSQVKDIINNTLFSSSKLTRFSRRFSRKLISLRSISLNKQIIDLLKLSKLAQLTKLQLEVRTREERKILFCQLRTPIREKISIFRLRRSWQEYQPSCRFMWSKRSKISTSRWRSTNHGRKRLPSST